MIHLKISFYTCFVKYTCFFLHMFQNKQQRVTEGGHTISGVSVKTEGDVDTGSCFGEL